MKRDWQENGGFGNNGGGAAPINDLPSLSVRRPILVLVLKIGRAHV